MREDLKEFWRRLQTGVEISVASAEASHLLGVRDGFRRYFAEGLRRSLPTVVVPQAIDEPPQGLAASDEEAVERARGKARRLADRLGASYHFYVASEGGSKVLALDGRTAQLITGWTVIVSPVGEAVGASGSIELPYLLPGRDAGGAGAGEGEPSPVPGTRREGGLVSSLTGGLESRRSSVSLATFHALCTLFYGLLRSHPTRSFPR